MQSYGHRIKVNDMDGLLVKYAIACVELYGLVPLEDFTALFNRLNDTVLDVRDVGTRLKDAQQCEDYFFVREAFGKMQLAHGRLCHDLLPEESLTDRIYWSFENNGIARYEPNSDEIMTWTAKYRTGSLSLTPQAKEFADFLVRRKLVSKLRADAIVRELLEMATDGTFTFNMLDPLYMRDIRLRDENLRQAVLLHLTNIFNTTPCWMLKGNALAAIGEPVSTQELMLLWQTTGMARAADDDYTGGLVVPKVVVDCFDLLSDTARLMFYLTAAARYYGFLPTDQLLTMINAMDGANGVTYTADSLHERASNIEQEEMGFTFAECDGCEYLLATFLLTVRSDMTWQEQVRVRSDVSWYVAQKAELIEYVDPDYYESTLQITELRAFLARATNLDWDELEDLISAVSHSARCGFVPADAITEYRDFGIVPSSAKQLEALVHLTIAVYRNSRCWHERGHRVAEHLTPGQEGNILRDFAVQLHGWVPDEFADQVGRNLIAAAPDDPDQDEEQVDTLEQRHVVKIGRNDPCPCGSGKKYKRCCGKAG